MGIGRGDDDRRIRGYNRAGNAGGASAPNDGGSQVIVAQISSIVPLGPEAMATNSAGIDRVWRPR